MKLKRNFYNRPTVEVARGLIGKILVRKYGGKLYEGEIIETEAYCGFRDLASHAARGKTPRNEIMFGLPGFAYVYLIYGIYHCLNIVTEKENFPAAVLIRGLDFPNADGPGKLCRVFQITRANSNGLDITSDILYLEDRSMKPKIRAQKRIGVDYAGEWKDKLWNFKKKI